MDWLVFILKKAGDHGLQHLWWIGSQGSQRGIVLQLWALVEWKMELKHAVCLQDVVLESLVYVVGRGLGGSQSWSSLCVGFWRRASRSRELSCSVWALWDEEVGSECCALCVSLL